MVIFEFEIPGPEHRQTEQKTILFEEVAHLLTLDQWRSLLKDVKNKSKRERMMMKKDINTNH